MSIEIESHELGKEVFKKDGLLNLIVSFLDNKSYMQFINVKNLIIDKINKRIYIYDPPTQKESIKLKNIKNIIQIKFKGDFDYHSILKKMETDKINDLEIEGAKNTDYSYISNLPSLKIFKIKCEKTNLNFIRSIKNIEELKIYFRPTSDDIFENKYYDKENLILNDIKFLNNLKILDLSAMAFDDISSLSNLSSLEKLNLNYCTVLKDFSSLKKLTKLKFLNLSNSNIKDIDFLKNLKSLIELNIASCDSIENLKPISNLKKLKSLIMSWIKYNADSEEIDLDFLEYLTELELLNIAHNKVSNYQSISFNKKLKTLLADDNELEDISFLENLKSLEILDISCNEKIKNYSCISKLNKLEKLYMSKNNLHDIKFICNLKNLKELYLSENKEINENDFGLLRKLRNIKKINLKNTSFGNDTSVLSEFKCLERVIVNRDQLSDGQISTLEGRKVQVKFF